MTSYSLIDCSLEEHGELILEIFNDAIVTSTALYDYQPRTLENMKSWFAAKAAGNFPVIGVVNESGDFMGFASFGTFRAYPAYKYTVEHSVYVHKDFRRLGLGKVLLDALIVRATEQEYHVLIGAIDASNAASISLHEGSGFQLVGTLPQVGFKFGRWLDLAFYQRILQTPAEPRDG